MLNNKQFLGNKLGFDINISTVAKLLDRDRGTIYNHSHEDDTF